MPRWQTADWPLWIAHRGAGQMAPENTLAAFRLGAAFGYRAFECDVKLSRDGVPMLLHDATLDRTTPEHGAAANRDWAELSRLDAGGWHSRAYAGEPIPSLEAIACYVQRNGFALNVEIKPTPGQERETGLAVGASCARLWAGLSAGLSSGLSAGLSADRASPLLFSSFRPDALQGARESAPTIPRALLVDSLWPGWFEMAQALECVAVVSHQELMNAGLAAQLHGAGLRAWCYTVNEVASAQRLLGLGVDGLITDAVDKFSPASLLA